MKIELTAGQKKHLKSLQWLYSGPRGSGRTTLLAYVLIDTVLSTHEEMRIVDHNPEHRADMNLAYIINMLISKNNLPLEITSNGLRLRYKFN